MDKKLMLIANPNAGTGKMRSAIGGVVEIFAQNGFLTTVFMTAARGDAERFARENAADYDLCVACGGDGTLSEVISGLVRNEKAPPLGFIPSGTANDVASSLGLPKNAKAAAHIAVSGEPIDYDVGCFNHEHFAYVAAFGAFTDVSYQTPQNIKARVGHLAYILEGMKRLPKITAYDVRVEFDGEVIEDRFIFAGVTNSTSMAGLVKLRPDEVSLNDGFFEVMLIRAPHDIIQFGYILNSITQHNYDPKYVHFFHAAELKFTLIKPIAWTLDGESGGEHREVVIKNKRAAIQMIAPKIAKS